MTIKAPNVEESFLVVYERHAVHHHNNAGEELPDTDFTLLFNVLPDKLGVRVKIVDQYFDGTATADVAVVYKWEHDVTADHNLSHFVEETALPQVLSCAATTLVDTASEITSDEVPFYGLSALEGMVRKFRERKRDLSQLLLSDDQELPEN